MTATFKDLGLSDEIVAALEKKGFEEPTPIQEKTIPVMLSGDQDVIGQAQTGTGKTAAFGLPIIEKISPNTGHIQAIILTPTRELTMQVCDELKSLKGKKALTVLPIYGGQSIVNQISQLKRQNDIIVGTPGRVIDHLKGKKMDLSQIKYFVLDEADEMLTSGFIEDIEFILSKTNDEKKTLLFSATMPAAILKLAKVYMKDYVTVSAKKETLATSLTEQFYYQVRESDKLEALCRIMDIEDDFYGLIFCRTKRDVDLVNEKLIQRGYDSEAMHGDLNQSQRQRVLQKFRQRHCSILVVTDVASRGLDISGLSHVVNYALPQDAESYVHRVGRTGRAGKTGKAINLLTNAEQRKLGYIKKIAKTDIKRAEVPSIKAIVDAKKNRAKASIESLMGSSLEEDYLDFAESLLEENDAKIALASALKLAFETEFSEKNYTKMGTASSHKDRNSRQGRNQGRDFSDSRGSRESRGPRGSYSRDSSRDSRGSRDSRDSRGSYSGHEKGDSRLFVAKGTNDEMTPRKLVALIENESRVHGKRIQGVQIYDQFSFINVSNKDADSILQAFRKPGKRSLVELAK